MESVKNGKFGKVERKPGLMERILEYECPAAQDGAKLGDFLRQRGYSRQVLIRLKKQEGSLLVNGESIFVSAVLRAGDRITVRVREEESSPGITPVELPLEIVYEDEDLLVVHKPADMPVHPSIHNYDNTLANALAWYFQQKGIPFVFRCINRLDRDTTGLLIVAKHMVSGAILSQQGKQREIRREYLAAAEGLTPESGVIDAPIGRKEGSIVERCVDWEHGDPARTRYRRLEYRNGYSLVTLKLETGRTHQIRVHMNSIGHPLAGDYLYHPDYRLFPHLALHSWRIAFRHPITGEAMRFETPPPWLKLLGLDPDWLDSRTGAEGL